MGVTQSTADPMWTLAASEVHAVLSYPVDLYNQSVGGLDGVRHTIQTGSIPVALTYDTRGNGDGRVVNTMAGDHQNRVTDYTALVLRNREGKLGGGKGPLLSAERSLTLGTSNDQVVFAKRQVVHPTLMTDHFGKHAGCNQHVAELAQILPAIGVPRRLTPVECERLMGWADGHTALGVDEQGREYALSDTARYKLCGNGVASPVAGWIAWRLKEALDTPPSQV